MKRFLSLLLVLAASLPIIQARTISGIVISDSDSTAVAGATCRLLGDQKYISGTSTDADGAFTLQTDMKSKLSLEVSMTGYESTEILIESGSKNINLGRVFLSEGVTLKEVTVTAQSQINSKGRTIVFPSMADVKASATSIRLFQKLPFSGLQADPINRTLSIDGGTPVILINGVPSTMEDVNSLQPKDIEKIEYSRITPARYADKGNNGLINITLKQRNDGGQFYAWGRSAILTAFVDANIQASYHQGPSQFTLSYNPSWRNYQKVYDKSFESYIGDDFRVNLETTDRNPFNYFSQNMRLKYDYSPNFHTLFSATFRATPFSNKSRVLAHTIDSELGTYDYDNTSKSKQFAPSLDLFFRRDFNDKNSIEAQLVGTLSSDDYRRDNLYMFEDGSEDNYSMDVDSRRRSLISEISYIHNFSDKTTLSAGYQNTVSRSTNSYLTSDYQPVLTENNNYIYARLGQQVGKVFFSVATGAKMFWVENDVNKRHFIRNLTTAQISWNIDKHWNIQGNFRYYPNIPSLTALTDYPQQISPYLISNGNPDLKVAENFFYGINFTYQTGKFSANYYSAMINTLNDVFTDVAYIGNHLFLSQSINAKWRRCFQNDLTLRISDLHGFGANFYMSFTHYQTAGHNWFSYNNTYGDEPTWRHHLNSFDASISLWWNKGPVTLSYWRKLPGKYLNGQTVRKDENGDALSVEYKPDNHWTIGVDWMYMFDKKGTRYPSWNYSAVNPSTNDRYIKHNGNMVVLSLTYSADFGSIFRTARRSLNNSDNSSSILKM